jgi:hypothetical protein
MHQNPTARSVWDQLAPEPNQVNFDKLDLKRFYSLGVPKSFIYCRQDKALPEGYFHPRMSSRLGVFRLLEMDGSHEFFCLGSPFHHLRRLNIRPPTPLT